MTAEFEVANVLDALTSVLDQLRGKSMPGVFVDTPPFDSLSIKPVDLAPWVRVTRIPGDAAFYGDDERVAEFPRVQVDFWLPVIADYSDLESQIYQLLHDAGWERYYFDAAADGSNPSLRMITGNYQYQGLPLG